MRASHGLVRTLMRGPRVPPLVLIVVLMFMTFAWGIAWRSQSALPRTPPGYTLVRIDASLPHPDQSEGWFCQNPGGYFGPAPQGPLCLVRDASLGGSAAAPVFENAPSVGGFEMTMMFISAVGALIAGLGAIGIKLPGQRRGSTVA
jgi:hypothetical protein